MHVLPIVFHNYTRISYDTTYENLIKHQGTSTLVTISFILMTCLFDREVILQGEIRFLSLLGLKGLLAPVTLPLFTVS